MVPSSGTIEHTADLGFWVQADNLAELFAAAASSLGELMFSGSRDGVVQWSPFACKGDGLPELLVQLLGEVVYQADALGLICVGLKVVELDSGSLDARMGLIPLDREANRVREPVKAVTYHRAEVARQGNGWRAQVFLDV